MSGEEMEDSMKRMVAINSKPNAESGITLYDVTFEEIPSYGAEPKIWQAHLTPNEFRRQELHEKLFDWLWNLRTASSRKGGSPLPVGIQSSVWSMVEELEDLAYRRGQESERDDG